MSSSSIAQKVCAVVLAGGQGSRMGGVDKGLQSFKGQALALHAVQRLQQQTPHPPAHIAVNANRNGPLYAVWGLPVWPDATEDFSGPLAGFQSALRHCREAATSYEYLLTVPCDSPRFPLDLLERLVQGLQHNDAVISVAAAAELDSTGQTMLRVQPVFCLLHTSLLASLETFMGDGGRKINAWIQQHRHTTVSFDHPSDDPLAFANANTLEQLHQLEQT